MNRYDEMREQVQAFHAEHPEVWRLFVRFTFQIIDRGYSNYSVNAIFERIRWEIDAGGDGLAMFKLNNNYRAFYARKFMRQYPEHEGFFRTRTQPSQAAPATYMPEVSPIRLDVLA